MRELIQSRTFARMLDERLTACATLKNFKCDLCAAERSDVLVFDTAVSMCGRCREQMRFLASDNPDMVQAKMQLLESLHLMIDAVGSCAPPGLVLSCFKNFFQKMRSIPELEKVIQEGLSNEQQYREDTED